VISVFSIEKRFKSSVDARKRWNQES